MTFFNIKHLFIHLYRTNTKVQFTGHEILFFFYELYSNALFQVVFYFVHIDY